MKVRKMEIEIPEIEKIEFLRSRVAEMYRVGVNFTELGNIALELLTVRNTLENKIDTIPKENMKKYSQTLKELEKTVISLYMLSIIDGKKKQGIEDYLFKEYTIFKR